MKRLFLIVFTFSLISICSAAVSAQASKRITFAKGATSKIVTGTVNSYKSVRTFVIHVKKGQTLTTESVDSLITIGVEAPPGSTYEQDMAADCHDHNEVNPTAAGDYKITVTECTKGDEWKGTFKFRITVK